MSEEKKLTPYLEIELDVRPTAKGRPRAFVKFGRASFYTPKKTADYEKLVKTAATLGMDGRKAMDGPILVAIHAEFAVAKSWAKGKKADALSWLIHHTSKPDMDNVVKAINDGLNGIAWVDDCQIVGAVETKEWAEVDRVIVKVFEAPLNFSPKESIYRT